MAIPARAASRPDSPDALQFGKETVRAEGQALLELAGRLDDRFERAVHLVLECRGSVLVTGMGKAGLIAQKISATLASTGTPSHFIHPAEAFHGDLGRINRRDVLIVLSQSGETEEIVRLLPSLADFRVPIVAVTASPASTLGRHASIVLELGSVEEACSLGLAPSTSTTAMLALGDAFALAASRLRGFRAEDFARYHPGGSLGLRLSRVEQQMRPLNECRTGLESLSVRELLAQCTRPGRRSGAIMLTDIAGKLTGLFTDSDLVRLLEQRREDALDAPVRQVMTSSPVTIPAGSRMSEAVQLMAARKISELPVVFPDGKPAGLIDITDVAGSWPVEDREPSVDTAASLRDAA